MTPGARVLPTRSNPNRRLAAERWRTGVVGNTGSLGLLYSAETAETAETAAGAWSESPTKRSFGILGPNDGFLMSEDRCVYRAGTVSSVFCQ